jgi:hypothetical protein
MSMPASVQKRAHDEQIRALKHKGKTQNEIIALLGIAKWIVKDAYTRLNLGKKMRFRDSPSHSKEAELVRRQCQKCRKYKMLEKIMFRCDPCKELENAEDPSVQD